MSSHIDALSCWKWSRWDPQSGLNLSNPKPKQVPHGSDAVNAAAMHNRPKRGFRETDISPGKPSKYRRMKNLAE